MHKYWLAVALLCLYMFLFIACGKVVKETGNASYYHNKFEGRKTANGEIFHQSKLTAAHKSLPFNTKVKVKNITNGKVVKVRINDRGPFVAGRIIDLSSSAAQKIGMLQQGVAPVQISYRKKKPNRS